MAYVTEQGATLEYSEWWKTAEWWKEYGKETCEFQPPVQLALDAFRAAPIPELVVFASLMAQMHHEYAPSLASLKEGPPDSERPYFVRLIAATVGGESGCYVSTGSPRAGDGVTGTDLPTNALEAVNELFWRMVDRVTIGKEPAPFVGPGTVYVGPGPTEDPALQPPAPPAPPPGDFVELGLEYTPTGAPDRGALLAAAGLLAFVLLYPTRRG